MMTGSLHKQILDLQTAQEMDGLVNFPQLVDDCGHWKFHERNFAQKKHKKEKKEKTKTKSNMMMMLMMMMKKKKRPNPENHCHFVYVPPMFHINVP